jgi:two-component system, response regulator PdtaR
MIMSASTPTTVQPLRVLVADASAEARAALAAALEASGHAVVAHAATGAEAVTRALALAPDVVLLALDLPEGSGADAAALIARAVPAPGIVLVSDDPGAALSDAEVETTGVVTLLATPVPRALLDASVRCAAARARELARARAEGAAARRQLEERKVIERAKGILMRRTGTTEQEAYRILQRSSQDKATPMAVLARAVLDSEPGAAAARP